MSNDELLEKARMLSPADQASLIEALMEQLDQVDKSIESEWAAEARVRLQAYRQGKLVAVPLQEVLAKYGR